MRETPEFVERACKLCGKVYYPRGNRQLFCSECKKIRAAERNREYRKRKYPDMKPKAKSQEACCVCGGKFSVHYEGNPYCNKHYLRMRNNGTPELIGRKTKNTYQDCGAFVRVTTTSGKSFIVDKNDVAAISGHTWCISVTGYAVSNIGGKVQKLHRFLLSVPAGMVVDHINGDPLDNRRENLRICTKKENSRNLKKKPGDSVSTGVQQKKNGKYRARIMVDRQEIAIGTFDTAEEAIAARRKAEAEYFGGYAPAASRTTSTRGESE